MRLYTHTHTHTHTDVLDNNKNKKIYDRDIYENASNCGVKFKNIKNNEINLVGVGVPKGITDLYSHVRSNNSEMLDDPLDPLIKQKYTKKSTSNNPTSNTAITLIALIITIIVLLILAGVTINMLMGENGIIKKAEIAREENNRADAKELLEVMLLDIKIQVKTEEKRETVITDCNKLEGKEDIEKIEYKSEQASAEYALITFKNYIFTVNEQLVITNQKLITSTEVALEDNESLLGAVANLIESGIQEISVNDEKYSANVIIYNGNLNLDGTTQITGATLSNQIYEFGNAETDCAKSTTEMANNMVILKVNGNLTIDENVTLTACKNESGYGGPKGMFIYCTGTITNNGTISMNARGAYAEGQNVYLWKNKDKSYEYVPAIGASGGVRKTNGIGNNGNDGVNRQTGGGASGGGREYNNSGTGGAGASGTSYSGGTGGGRRNWNFKYR